MLTAFVRAEGNVDSLFSANGCQQLLSCGDIYIVAMPISNIAALSQNSQVSRIESQRGTHALMDISGAYLGATKAYQGLSLPQAYTGKGVMVGVMDIGFDLTHPNFYDRSATNYRIRSFGISFLPTPLTLHTMLVRAIMAKRLCFVMLTLAMA